MIKKNKNVMTFLSIVIILIISMFFVYSNKKEYHELPKIKLEEENNKRQFALMIEQTKGKGDYQEDSEEYPNTFPTEGYRFNESMSSCIDMNGQEIEGAIEYNYENYSITINTSKTIFCYLYYDIYENTITPLELVESKPKYLSESLVGDMYRYQGLYTDDIRNYICLGDNCCKTAECDADDNDDMYRIIGITNSGEIKVVKKTTLTDKLEWWNDYQTNIKWPQSLIYQKLNGKSDDGTSNYNLEDKNSYYYSLDENLKSLIINNHSWLYGDTISNGGFNGAAMYGIESGKSKATYYNHGDSDGSPTGKSEWNERIEAPLGIMYISDYYYAYKTNEGDVGNPGNWQNALNSWVHISHNQSTNRIVWTMVRYGFNTGNDTVMNNDYLIWCLNGDGFVGGNVLAANSLRPSFYLKSDIELAGEGSLTNPFRIPGVG